tara:strand:+ start:226 stop:429 length:204 start_codon:yes stop_codon:yes gene_type:complete
MDPKEQAQLQAEVAMTGFIEWSKRTGYAAVAFLLIVASCNFGVEDGPAKTGSGYNGEQYAPTNLKVK